ncbi:hydroxymethylbilane synthase [Aquabacterium sp. CECT 9606]|uniref:hydroxymethylbilane synthase n=1 Tax=Aquabacterium sp. CECT 9606 TaxID=2845822 RepID=UPI001E3F0495|nr:hydroxymethylbilane synthase [Aquabacterium sp. CECT 9606]CAH0354331.1 Porphobilinogen deaminase [Aquabacterium sp. CECT 9606]
MTAHDKTPSAWVIATRESRLALWQAEHVRDLLQTRFSHPVSLLGMTTRGDQILDRSLSKVGGKGLFVKELEVALEEGRADLAVHSLKDVPMELPDGFVLACVLEREDPRDAFVSNDFATLDALPQGAVVGTSSLRRLTQLRALRPDLKIEPLRGNLDTRLRKLDDGHYAAIILATAGLKRLGLAERIRQVIDTNVMLPAAGQGALGIEVRLDHPDLVTRLATLTHTPTWLATLAERAVSRALGGSCSMPLAAHAQWSGSDAATPGTMTLRALLGHPAQNQLVRAQLQGSPTTPAEAEALGQQVAQQLQAQAGPEWLAALVA